MFKPKNAQLTRRVISGFGRCSQRAGAKIACRTASVHCLPDTEQPFDHTRKFVKPVCAGPACQVENTRKNRRVKRIYDTVIQGEIYDYQSVS